MDKAVKLARPDDDRLLLENRKRNAADAKELMLLFKKADVDGSETLSLSEFEAFLAVPRFKDFLLARGIDIKEVRTFFNLLAEAIGKNRELDVNRVSCAAASASKGTQPA